MSAYAADMVAWTEIQAALLRRRAAGDLLNEADLDWSNIGEEIEGAREIAASSLAGEAPLIDPATVGFTVDQVLGPGLP